MAEITVKINERTRAGKAFKALLEVFVKENKGVELVEKSPYNSKFVKKIQRAERQKGVRVDNVQEWIESL